jgi:hypothetical protein
MAAGGYIVSTSHHLRWIEYLPEVGQPILDELKWIYEAESLLKARKADLLSDISRLWPEEEKRRARELAKSRPGTNPTPGELNRIRSQNRVGTEG